MPDKGDITRDGWALESAEARHEAHPETFRIPSALERSRLAIGDAAKLLFQIETREQGRVVDSGFDRMWVIVRAHVASGYVGVLESDPGLAENLRLRPGQDILFGPEHICDVDHPPRAYIISKYGPEFFEP